MAVGSLGVIVRGAALGLTLVVLTTGCAGGGGVIYTEESATPAPSENCIVLANGNRLCGADAKAYCQGFAQDSLDRETNAACISVGADTTSAREDRRIAEEDQEEQVAAENRKTIAAAADFEPAAKDVLGGAFLGTRLEGPGEVVVETFYERHGETDTSIPVPRASKLRKVCSAVHRVNPAVTVTIAESDGSTPLKTCPPER